MNERNGSVGATATPRSLGFTMPAEWAKHDAIWLSWPYDPETFPDRVDKAELAYIEIISAIHTSEKVNLLVTSEDKQREVSRRLSARGVAPGRVEFHIFDYADVWFRDYGPIFVTDAAGDRIAMTDWIFNAWGGKYEPLMKDNRIPAEMNRKLALQRFEPGIVLEGGSIDVNGRGALLTTEQCLLNPNRNPRLSRGEIEKYLLDYLGAEKIIWLKNGIEGDDTDGHIDDIARFTGPNTVLCAAEPEKSDPNHDILEENFHILKSASDQDGRPIDVIELPMPPPVSDDTAPLPASYTNFYIGNTVVLVPQFQAPETDERALKIIQSCFRERRCVGIDCSDLVHGLGTLHCISQQQPSVFPPKR